MLCSPAHPWSWPYADSQVSLSILVSLNVSVVWSLNSMSLSHLSLLIFHPHLSGTFWKPPKLYNSPWFERLTLVDGIIKTELGLVGLSGLSFWHTEDIFPTCLSYAKGLSFVYLWPRNMRWKRKRNLGNKVMVCAFISVTSFRYAVHWGLAGPNNNVRLGTAADFNAAVLICTLWGKSEERGMKKLCNEGYVSVIV